MKLSSDGVIQRASNQASRSRASRRPWRHTRNSFKTQINSGALKVFQLQLRIPVVLLRRPGAPKIISVLQTRTSTSVGGAFKQWNHNCCENSQSATKVVNYPLIYGSESLSGSEDCFSRSRHSVVRVSSMVDAAMRATPYLNRAAELSASHPVAAYYCRLPVATTVDAHLCFDKTCSPKLTWCTALCRLFAVTLLARAQQTGSLVEEDSQLMTQQLQTLEEQKTARESQFLFASRILQFYMNKMHTNIM